MSVKLYVGGLAWATTDQGLQQAFTGAGNVVSAKVMTDKFSGRSRGFGFVEMETEEEANKAIDMWNEKELDGRKIIVNIAKPMEERAPRQGGYDRGPRDFNRGSRGGFGGDRGGFSGGGNRGGFGGGGSRGRGGSGFRSGSR